MEEYKEVGESGPLTDPSGKVLSYEDLKNTCLQMSNQLDTLSRIMNKTQQEEFYKKLDYNFKVISKEYFGRFSPDFLTKITDEIEVMLLPPDKE